MHDDISVGDLVHADAGKIHGAAHAGAGLAGFGAVHLQAADFRGGAAWRAEHIVADRCVAADDSTGDNSAETLD